MKRRNTFWFPLRTCLALALHASGQGWTSEAWHRVLGDTATQPVPELRFSAKGTSFLYLVPTPNAPIKALIGRCKRNSLNAVPDTKHRP